MQLNAKRKGQVGLGLSLMTANLLLATGAMAQASERPLPTSAGAGLDAPDIVNDEGLTRVDAAVMMYQEDHGGVKATEPEISITWNRGKNIFSATLLYDAVSGATPTGAVASRNLQDFVVYKTLPYTVPVYPYFDDKRKSLALGYTRILDNDLRVSVGAYKSEERDYTVYSYKGGVSKELFEKNTTLSLEVERALDRISPSIGGIPRPFGGYGYSPLGPAAHKTGTSAVVSITQVMNRAWLTQLSYSYGKSEGYHTEAYREVALVNPVTGAPLTGLYESRPDHRVRQSLYWGNKIAIGPTVLSLAARKYHDDWGIDSITLDVSERVPITSWLYVEPGFRYYDQTAADFYVPYLLAGKAFPKYASADFRVSKFKATTIGVKVGLKTPMNGELYIQADQYVQDDKNRRPNAPGDLAFLPFFDGVNATKVIVGYTFAY